MSQAENPRNILRQPQEPLIGDSHDFLRQRGKDFGCVQRNNEIKFATWWSDYDFCPEMTDPHLLRRVGLLRFVDVFSTRFAQAQCLVAGDMTLQVSRSAYVYLQ